MNKKVSTDFAISVIILIAGFVTTIFFLANKNIESAYLSQPNKSIVSTKNNNDTGNNDLDKLAAKADSPKVSGLEVTSLKKDDLIKSPLIIKGKAKGIWFFEGEFPIKLMDGKGNFFASGNAIAQGEWMTENWVNFEATIKFQKPATAGGFLYFSKNDPSGLPQNSYSVSLPIKFSAN
jgi:hypothetical protein